MAPRQVSGVRQRQERQVLQRNQRVSAVLRPFPGRQAFREPAWSSPIAPIQRVWTSLRLEGQFDPPSASEHFPAAASKAISFRPA